MTASVAVLSDIHGVLPALNAVLAEPDVADAETIVLTGDIAVGCRLDRGVRPHPHAIPAIGARPPDRQSRQCRHALRQAGSTLGTARGRRCVAATEHV